jgi:hypothetical protein
MCMDHVRFKFANMPKRRQSTRNNVACHFRRRTTIGAAPKSACAKNFNPLFGGKMGRIAETDSLYSYRMTSSSQSFRDILGRASAAATHRRPFVAQGKDAEGWGHVLRLSFGVRRLTFGAHYPFFRRFRDASSFESLNFLPRSLDRFKYRIKPPKHRLAAFASSLSSSSFSLRR